MHKIILENFYITLGTLSGDKMASHEGYEEMLLEANNTKATLLRLLESNHEDKSGLINACICSGNISALQLEKYKRKLAGLLLQNDPSSAETSHTRL